MSINANNLLSLTLRRVYAEPVIREENISSSQNTAEILSASNVSNINTISRSEYIKTLTATLDEMDLDTVNVIAYTSEDVSPAELYNIAVENGLYPVSDAFDINKGMPKRLHLSKKDNPESGGSGDSSAQWDDNLPRRLHLKKVEPPEEPEDPPVDPEDPEDPPVEPDVPEEPEEPEEEIEDLILVRKGENTADKTLNSKGIKLTLTNSADGVEYTYTIKPKDGVSGNVKLEYLDNHRLLIIGDNLEITATSGQRDDLIIFGNNNIINTGDFKDYVRVGCVVDSNFYFDEKICTGNEINTGTGDDYVQNYGANKIIMGSGSDALLDLGGHATSKSGAETTFGITNQTSDNALGWGMQGGYGDCKLLAVLDSLCTNNSLSKYVTITKIDSGYKVYFKKSKTTQYVRQSDFTFNTASGDMDFKIVETAFRLIIAGLGYNMDNDDTGNPLHDDYELGSTVNDWLISKYIFGLDYDEDVWHEYKLTDYVLEWAVGRFNSNSISQVTFALGNDTDAYEKFGIYSGHAYGLKGGVKNKYVDLVNPHDGNDIIRLEWNDFLSIFGTVMFFGDTLDIAAAEFNIDLKTSRAANLPIRENTDEIDEILEQIDGVRAVMENNTVPNKLKFVS